MSSTILTRIGPCGLTTTLGPDDEVIGYWREASCAEWCEVVAAHGGLENLSVWSGFTNLDYSDLGPPFVFTEWGTKGDDERPVVADGGHPGNRMTGTGPCRLTHAIFVPA